MKLVELGRGFGLTRSRVVDRRRAGGYWIFAGLLDNVLYEVHLYKAGLRLHEGWVYTSRMILSMSARRLVPVAVTCF